MNDFLKKDKAIVLFYAEWCSPCKNFLPVIEEVSLENKDISLYKFDGDKNKELTKQYDIKAYPTVLFFKNGNIEKTHIGYVDIKEFTKIVKGVF